MDKYEEVDRARRLLRQGAQKAALKILDNLCDNWDSTSSQIEEDSQTLELEFHPRKDDIPHFFVDDGCLCIDDHGWEIDQDLISHITVNVSNNYLMGMADMDLRSFIRGIFKTAIKDGKVRRKGNGEEI